MIHYSASEKYLEEDSDSSDNDQESSDEDYYAEAAISTMQETWASLSPEKTLKGKWDSVESGTVFMLERGGRHF